MGSNSWAALDTFGLRALSVILGLPAGTMGRARSPTNYRENIMAEQRTIEIEGHTYKLDLFGAKEGQRVFFRLITFLGPMVGAAAGGGGWKGIGPALETFARSATPEAFEGLAETFAEKTTLMLTAKTKTGDKAVQVQLSKVYDTHFAQRYQALFTWLGWAVKENFESFLGSGGKDSLLDLLGLVRVSKSSAPTESTGSSGDPESPPT